MTRFYRFDTWLQHRRTAIGLLGTLFGVELLALVAYLLWTGAIVTAPRYLLYPFVWANAAVLVVLAVDAPSVGRWVRLAGIVGGGVYFVLLAWVAGLVGFAHGGHFHVDVFWLPPGWGPLLVVHGPVTLTLIPFKLVGYLGLAYLVYATILTFHARATTALGGAVGLGSCVSCAAPLASGLASGLLGGSFPVAASSLSYDLSTGVFLASLLLLWTAARN